MSKTVLTRPLSPFTTQDYWGYGGAGEGAHIALLVGEGIEIAVVLDSQGLQLDIYRGEHNTVLEIVTVAPMDEYDAQALERNKALAQAIIPMLEVDAPETVAARFGFMKLV